MGMRMLATTIAYQIPRHGVRGIGVRIEPNDFEDYMRGRVRDAHVLAHETDAVLDDLREAGAADGLDFDYDEVFKQMKAGMPAEPWRIGEDLAACYLEDDHKAEIYRPNLDLRNPQAISAGADLVGYSSLNGMTVFLFGEVKTPTGSGKRPPPVMRQLRQQLGKLERRADQLHLIRWLQIRRKEGGAGAIDPSKYRDAIASYVRHGRLLLVGVLITEETPDEDDLLDTCDSLAGKRGQSAHLQTDLFALYVPARISDLPGLVRGDSS